MSVLGQGIRRLNEKKEKNTIGVKITDPTAFFVIEFLQTGTHTMNINFSFFLNRDIKTINEKFVKP